MAEKGSFVYVALGLLIGVPLGIGILWLINQLSSRASPTSPTTVQQPQSLMTPVSNVERWEWTDRRGKKRVIEVHRRLEYG